MANSVGYSASCLHVIAQNLQSTLAIQVQFISSMTPIYLSSEKKIDSKLINKNILKTFLVPF